MHQSVLIRHLDVNARVGWTTGCTPEDLPIVVTALDPEKTRPTAERLCAVIGDKFQVEFGGFRDEPIGPHPVANLQVIFKPEQFQPVVEWLMLHRDGLDVLIHPLTDDSVNDHSIYAMWLGSPVPLKLNTLRRNYRAELLPSA